MKLKTLVAALLAAGAAHAAHAGDATVLEPGLRFAWTFGAKTETKPSLSLGLYPNDLGWRRLWADAGAGEMSRVDAPAVLDWRLGDARGMHLMGLPLNADALGLNAAEGESRGNWGMRVGLIVLAAGAAAALVINAAGDAAEDNNPAVGLDGAGGDDDGDGGGTTGVGEDGIGCVNGQCAVPCETTDTCGDGG